ncbi:hypothetical protein [Methylobacterium gregans]|uniref:hypothetical protein n=1 Tax=Methylobacterium gregans TaxID=374424 RepID=UPI00360F5F12
MTTPESTVEEQPPALSQDLLKLMEAFEAEVARHPDSGLPAWIARARTDELARRLTFPTGLLTDTASAELGARPDPLAWLQALSRPEAYTGTNQTRRARAIFHGATARAVNDLLVTMGRQSLFEVAHNAGLFAHLSSTLWTYQALDAGSDDVSDTALFWADLASEKAEPEIGGDFAFVVPLDAETCKLAIVQAKPESAGGLCVASLYRKVTKDPGQQFGLLLQHEEEHPVRGAVRKAVFGSWCFYAFWHRPGKRGGVLSPVVRAAWDIDGRERFTNGRGAAGRTLSRVSTTANGVELATFLSLLPDRNSMVGLTCSRSDLPRLIGVDLLKPRSVILLNLPEQTWPLRYWSDLLIGLPGYVDMTRHRLPGRPRPPSAPQTAAPQARRPVR